MPYDCHVSLTRKYLYVTFMCSIDACLYFFPAYRTLILCRCFSPFGCLEDKPEIDDDVFFHLFARFRWLRVLEGGNCVACHALHFIELPCQTSFCPFFIFLLVCFWQLSTLLPPLFVIPVFTMGIRVLLLYVSKIPPTYFNFFIRAR